MFTKRAIIAIAIATAALAYSAGVHIMAAIQYMKDVSKDHDEQE